MPKTEIKEPIEVVQYQWIKGDNQGTIEEYASTKGKFIEFKSGRRCNKALVGEYINKIDLDNTVLEFEDPLQVIKNPSKVKPITPIPAKTANPIEKVSSPIIPLFEKSKKKKTKLNVRVEMELPSKEFLEVLQESWEEDILSIQAEFIVSKIADPKQFLTEKIKVSLSEWFSKTTKG